MIIINNWNHDIEIAGYRRICLSASRLCLTAKKVLNTREWTKQQTEMTAYGGWRRWLPLCSPACRPLCFSRPRSPSGWRCSASWGIGRLHRSLAEKVGRDQLITVCPLTFFVIILLLSQLVLTTPFWNLWLNEGQGITATHLLLSDTSRHWERSRWKTCRWKGLGTEEGDLVRSQHHKCPSQEETQWERKLFWLP